MDSITEIRMKVANILSFLETNMKQREEDRSSLA